MCFKNSFGSEAPEMAERQ